MLERVWDGPAPVGPQLAELTRLEFIHEVQGLEERAFVFKHALTQDVAYDGLLAGRRKRLHEAAGAALEELYAGRLEEVYDRLAHHYSHTDRSDKAVHYLDRFAERAVRTYAHAEASKALREALVHVERLPAGERERRGVELVLRLVNSLYFVGRFGESLDLLLHQEATVERIADPWLSGPFAMWLGHTYTHAGDSEGAARSISRAFVEAEGVGDLATIGKAHYVLAREGARLARRGRRARPPRRRGAEPDRRLVVARARVLLDGPEPLQPRPLRRGARRGRAGARHRRRARRPAHPQLLGLERRVDPGHARGLGDGHRRLHREPGDVAGQPQQLLQHGVAGFRVQGEGRLCGGDPVPGAVDRAPHRVPVLAPRRLVQGVAERGVPLGRGRRPGLTVADQALRVARELRYVWGMALARRALGRIALARGALGEAERHLGEALRPLDEMGAPLRRRLRGALARRGGRPARRPPAAEAHLADASPSSATCAPALRRSRAAAVAGAGNRACDCRGRLTAPEALTSPVAATSPR